MTRRAAKHMRTVSIDELGDVTPLIEDRRLEAKIERVAGSTRIGIPTPGSRGR